MVSPVVVFDAYGTLFNVHAAIARYRDAAGPEADRLSEIWRTKQLEYTWTLTLAGRYRDFWMLTQEALDFALSRVPSVDPALRQRLLDAYLVLDAFPDARLCLGDLKQRRVRTAILSNGSPRMLQAAVEAAKLETELDAVLSVDAVRLYKPRPEVYRLVTTTFDTLPENVMFISSNRWDVAGALAYGFRAIWVNRGNAPNEYADVAPTAVLPDLTSLPALIA